MRGTTTIGYVITPFGALPPTAANITLASGTLWIEASLLGAAFALNSGVCRHSVRQREKLTVSWSGDVRRRTHRPRCRRNIELCGRVGNEPRNRTARRSRRPGFPGREADAVSTRDRHVCAGRRNDRDRGSRKRDPLRAIALADACVRLDAREARLHHAARRHPVQCRADETSRSRSNGVAGSRDGGKSANRGERRRVPHPHRRIAGRPSGAGRCLGESSS